MVDEDCRQIRCWKVELCSSINQDIYICRSQIKLENGFLIESWAVQIFHQNLIFSRNSPFFSKKKKISVLMQLPSIRSYYIKWYPDLLVVRSKENLSRTGVQITSPWIWLAYGGLAKDCHDQLKVGRPLVALLKLVPFRYTSDYIKYGMRHRKIENSERSAEEWTEDFLAHQTRDKLN